MTAKSRLIDTMIHRMSYPQVMGTLLDFIDDDRAEPVVIVCPKGMGLHTMMLVRNALAKNRKKYQAENPGARIMQFGLTQEGPVPYKSTIGDGEAMLVRFRITPRQAMLNAWEHARVSIAV